MGKRKKEIWKPVAGYEALYSVSSLGRVRRDGPGIGVKVGRILRHGLAGKGYPCVNLWDRTLEGEARMKTRYVHHLVAIAFLGPKPDRHEIKFRDNNRMNAKASNLEYKPSGPIPGYRDRFRRAAAH